MVASCITLVASCIALVASCVTLVASCVTLVACKAKDLTSMVCYLRSDEYYKVVRIMSVNSIAAVVCEYDFVKPTAVRLLIHPLYG